MSSTVRVLHLADVINRYDFIDNVLRYCDRARFRVFACTFTDGSNIQPPAYADVPHYVLRANGRRSYPHAVATLAAILRRERIDIVHTHHFDPMVIGVTAARMTGRSAVIGRHYSDTIHRLRSPWKREVYLRTEALFHRLAARIIVPSTRIYELLTHHQGVDVRKVVHIPYGFDLTKYVTSADGPEHLRKEFAPNNQVLVGSFGRLHPEKGHIYLLQAMHALLPSHRRLRILLVGAGPDKQILESAARELQLDSHVIFAGWRADVTDLLATVDIVVQPSVSGEGFSQAMIEALVMGKPLVVSDVSGARDAVEHGVNGLVVPPADPAAIAVAIRTLLENPHLARRLGEAGRTYVRQNLDIRSVVRRYEECYRAVHAESHAA